jgi:hypothetical protein
MLFPRPMYEGRPHGPPRACAPPIGFNIGLEAKLGPPSGVLSGMGRPVMKIGFCGMLRQSFFRQWIA